LTPKEFFTIERPHTYLIFVYNTPAKFSHKSSPTREPQLWLLNQLCLLKL